jgi:hypothetical protein
VSLLLALLLSAFVSAAPAFSRTPFPLVDQAKKDASFLRFRKRLLKAVDKKDVKTLLEAVDPDIKLDFGGKSGKDAFIEEWDLNEPAESGLWKELGAVLRLGGSFHGKDFQAPYVFSDWPGKFDSFDYVAVVSESAVLRAKPDKASPSLLKLKREIVAYVQEKDDWEQVRAFDGTLGWLPKEGVRSPVDYRAIFRRLKGKWKLSFFIAGD